MALQKKKLNEIPPDAVMLSEEEAMKYHFKILNTWKVKSDVLAYNYGSLFLGACSALSGAYLNHYFRRKLKLLSYGRISSYLPICIAPAAMAVMIHHEHVVKELVLLKQEQCPICLELRASAIQSFFGAVMPFTLAPVTSIGLAHRFVTYNIPHIQQEPMKVLQLIGKFVKPIKNILFGIFIGQALLGSAVTYLEARSIYNVHFKLAELEKNLENQFHT